MLWATLTKTKGRCKLSRWQCWAGAGRARRASPPPRTCRTCGRCTETSLWTSWGRNIGSTDVKSRMFLGPRGPLGLPLVDPLACLSAMKIWIPSIQAYMPRESSGDTSNQSSGPMRSPRDTPLGPLVSPGPPIDPLRPQCWKFSGTERFTKKFRFSLISVSPSKKKYRARVPTILMPQTFPIASLNPYTPNF